jgi:hypothetical protein
MYKVIYVERRETILAAGEQQQRGKCDKVSKVEQKS